MRNTGKLLASSLAPAVAALLVTACGGSEPPPAAPPAPPAPAASVAPPAPAASAAPADSSSAGAGTAAATPPAPAKPAPSLSLHDAGFATPESVLYDAKNDVYLVSNINGGPSAADGNGFISRVAADGSKVDLKWIEGGKNGAKLDAPKGLTIAGDVLYVADLTRVRMFDPTTGKAKGEVPLPGATFANDIAAAPDGRVFVSDSGIKIDDKGVTPTHSDAVYVIEKKKAKVLAKGDDLGHPNGLLFANDAGGKANEKLWVVTFGSGELYSLDKEGKKGDASKLPQGQLDGIVPLGDGVLVSSWEAQGVFRGKAGGTFDLVLTGLKAPADIGYDTKRSRVLVPLFQDNAVEAYDLQ
jgi:sugar lactone lactonase YvrE